MPAARRCRGRLGEGLDLGAVERGAAAPMERGLVHRHRGAEMDGDGQALRPSWRMTALMPLQAE